MNRYNRKDCIECGTNYQPTGASSKYCTICAVQKKKACRYREKVLKRTGVGRGNSPSNRGATHPMYKNGIGMYKKIRDEKLVEQEGKCSHCSVKIDASNPHMWCGHHIDHDRTNNDRDNIEVVCKRCHQIEHDCVSNFKKGATTIPKGSTHKCVEAPSP